MGAAVQVAGLGAHLRQADAERPDALLGDQGGNRIGVFAIERLDGVGDGVHAARPAVGRRQRDRQFGIVDHRPGQHPRVELRRLDAVFGETLDGRHFRAGIGRRHGEHRLLGLNRNALAEADGGAAADRDIAVGVDLVGDLARFVHRFHRRVHDRLVVDAGGAAVQQPGGHFGIAALFGRRDHERPLGAQPLHLGRQFPAPARPEDHPGGQAGIGEGIDHAAGLLLSGLLSGRHPGVSADNRAGSARRHSPRPISDACIRALPRSPFRGRSRTGRPRRRASRD